MKPASLQTKIFVDSGDPRDTQKALEILGTIEGQTTNPSLVAKNPDVQDRIKSGKSFTDAELRAAYKDIIQQISSIIPNGSVSIEVYADTQTTSDNLLHQAEEMFTWIPNAHIKFPTNTAGLEAAEAFIRIGGRVNMTLCFSQTQAQAVHQATKGAKKGDVFYSSFVGRLFDKNINGIELLQHTKSFYDSIGSHVEVLAASFRNLDQILAALAMRVDIITFPPKYIQEWADTGFFIPEIDYKLPDVENIQSVAPESHNLDLHWRDLHIENEMTRTGVIQFADDWNKLLS